MNKKVDSITMLIQVVLGFSIIIMMIISLFTNVLNTALQILIIPELCIMAYNNQKIYKRKYMTFIYLAIALYLLITLIIGVL